MTNAEIKKAIVNLIANEIDEVWDEQINFIEMYGPYIHVCTVDGQDKSFAITLREARNDYDVFRVKYNPHS